MATFKNSTRCYPFSSQPFQGRLVCCDKMNLVSALNHTFKCLTCLMRKNAPTGVLDERLASYMAGIQQI